MQHFSLINKIFPRSELAKNTFTLITGTIIAQLIPLILHPILRRIYSPEDFGVFAVYLNIFGIIIIMATLRYEAAIMLPNNNIEAANILSLSFIINFILCSSIFILLLFFKDNFCNLINFPIEHSNYLYLLPFSAMFCSFYQSINFWLIRQKAFKSSSINKMSRRSVEGLLQLGIGYKKLSFGLVVGDFFGNLTNVISGIIQIKKNSFNINYISKKKIFYVLKRYKKFPLYNFLPTLLSSAATFLPFIFINKLYSSEDVGYLDLSRLVLSIPLAFISVSISQVIFQQITFKRNNQQSIKKDLLNILYFILAIAIIEYILIQLFGPTLFAFVFGNKYNVSGEYSKILVYSYIMNFIISTYSSIFISFEKLKILSVWQISYFLIICSLLFFKNLALVKFLEVYVLIEIIMSIVYCVVVYYIIKKYETQISSIN